jgi:hypothetical protein
LRSWRFLGELCGQKLLAVKKAFNRKEAKVRKSAKKIAQAGFLCVLGDFLANFAVRSFWLLKSL